MKESMESFSWHQDSNNTEMHRVHERKCRYGEDRNTPWAAELCTLWTGWPCFPALDKRKDKPLWHAMAVLQQGSQNRLAPGKSRKPFLHSEQQPVRERKSGFYLIWVINRDHSLFSYHKFPAIIWVYSSLNKVWLIWTSMGKSTNKTSLPTNCTFENKLQWVLRPMRETNHIPHKAQWGCCCSGLGLLAFTFSW